MDTQHGTWPADSKAHEWPSTSKRPPLSKQEDVSELSNGHYRLQDQFPLPQNRRRTGGRGQGGRLRDDEWKPTTRQHWDFPYIMEGMLYPSQAPLSLSIYKSSYMVDYKDFSNYTPHLENPEEQRKIEAQLRQKEFCPAVSPSTSRLMKGYPAFRDPQMITKDLEPCAFSQELAQKAPQAQPRICPSDYYPSLDPKKIPEYKTRYQSKRFPKPLELNYPLPEIGGPREPTDTQFPSDLKPIPFRWGPLKPFYL